MPFARPAMLCLQQTSALASCLPICRERQLLSAGLQAFQHALAEAREQRRVARVAALGFAGWRRLAASSGAHPKWGDAESPLHSCFGHT